MSKIRSRASKGLISALAGVAFATATGPSKSQSRHSEYRLQSGDVVEIVVAGIPELRNRVAVQIDGSITFPLVGTLMVEGAPVSQVRSRIQSAIASKVFRSRLSDGRELIRTIERDDIAASVVEYKPVFVTGDIARHGEQAFRPRMQVRQAIAAAGGSTANPQVGGASQSLRADHSAAWLHVALGMAREWRIRQELGEQSPLHAVALQPGPLSSSAIAKLVEVEQQYMAARQVAHEQSKGHLKLSLDLISDQISALSSKLEADESGLTEDRVQHKRAKDAFGSGNLPSRRVHDQRRLELMTSTRVLETTAQLLAARRTHADIVRDLQKIDSDRRIALLAELQETQLKLNVERARLHSLEERMQASGIRPETAEGRGKSRLNVSIHRKGSGGPVQLIGDLDTELEPGDVVEVVVADPAELRVQVGFQSPGGSRSGSSSIEARTHMNAAPAFRSE